MQREADSMQEDVSEISSLACAKQIITLNAKTDNLTANFVIRDFFRVRCAHHNKHHELQISWKGPGGLSGVKSKRDLDMQWPIDEERGPLIRIGFGVTEQIVKRWSCIVLCSSTSRTHRRKMKISKSCLISGSLMVCSSRL